MKVSQRAPDELIAMALKSRVPSYSCLSINTNVLYILHINIYIITYNIYILQGSIILKLQVWPFLGLSNQPHLCCSPKTALDLWTHSFPQPFSDSQILLLRSSVNMSDTANDESAAGNGADGRPDGAAVPVRAAVPDQLPGLRAERQVLKQQLKAAAKQIRNEVRCVHVCKNQP